MNFQIPNLEEAANVAAEFIYSESQIPSRRYVYTLNHRTGVDNLPGEVGHLLQEIRHRESRAVGQLVYPFLISLK
jgi:chromatin modification-related protein YNG2